MSYYSSIDTFALRATADSLRIFNVTSLPHMRTMSICMWMQIRVATQQYKQEMGSDFEWPLPYQAFVHRNTFNHINHYNMKLLFYYYPNGLQTDGSDHHHQLTGYFRVAKHSQTMGLQHR